jgi:manganese-dependent ADP-ribose/CDP-alcohol diphosphatase
MDRRGFLGFAFAATACSTLTTSEASCAASNGPLRLGVVADPQYADIDNLNTRFYRQSIEKLTRAVEYFNEQELSFCVNLGDTIDKHWQSYDQIMVPFSKSRYRVHHVLGNHDFDLLDEFKSRVSNRLGIPNRYYSHEMGRWRFVFLDTTDVSLYAQPSSEPTYAVADNELKKLKSTNAIHAQSWNGSVSQRQLDWFQDVCTAAAKKQQRVIVFSHHPVFPANAHNAWNSSQILEVVGRHRNVVAWMNGHNHAGNLGIHEDVPFVTMKGMVETTDTNAFSVVSLHEDRLLIEGHGREPSRELKFRPLA